MVGARQRRAQAMRRTVPGRRASALRPLLPQRTQPFVPFGKLNTQTFAQPSPCPLIQQRQRGIKVLLILLQRLHPRLVEQLNLGTQKRNAIARNQSQFAQCPADRSVPLEQPFITLGIEQHHLQTPRTIRRFATPHIRVRRLKPLRSGPLNEFTLIGHGTVPTLKQLPDRPLIATEHHHIEVAMLTGRPAHEQFDGVATGDPPLSPKPREQRRCFLDGERIPNMRSAIAYHGIPCNSSRLRRRSTIGTHRRMQTFVRRSTSSPKSASAIQSRSGVST